jgi:hypothetical protein
VQPDFLSPLAWLKQQPLQPSQQLFAIFSNASAAKPLEAWRRSNPTKMPMPIWADTAYAEWDAVMPFVASVIQDSEFLQWVATTTSRDWGWLAVSCASQPVFVEHLRSLTQVLLPNGSAVFFRFWDGRYAGPMLECAEVDAAQLLPAIGRCLINGQPLDVSGNARSAAKDFPWWEVPQALLQQLGAADATTRINNLMQWLSEEQSAVFEAFEQGVLRCKIANFLAGPDISPDPKAELLAYLMEESG